jgi:hypothetical protein
MTGLIESTRLNYDIQDPTNLPGTIWGLTTYYNPAGYSKKLINYREFSKSLKAQNLKLLTVELAFGDSEFELSEEDADILIRYRTENKLWHKERLLNLGLGLLPEDCDKVVWLDADILFFDPLWVEKTARLLEKYRIIQPFSFAVRFPHDRNILSRRNINKIRRNDPAYQGFIYSFKQPRGALKVQNSGLAWAGRRDIFLRHGFYDRLILGSGDKLMGGAFLGFRFADEFQRFPGKMIDHQNQWILKIHREVGGSVTYQDGVIGHLFHGTMTKRNYFERTNILKDNDFDPVKDIMPDSNGIWKWATDKTEMHHKIIDYFHSREEDAIPVKLPIYIKLYYFIMNTLHGKK